MHISHLGDSIVVYLINLFVVLAPRKPHLRSDTSQSKTPSVSDPEKIIHRRSWKEKKSVRAVIPDVSIEDYPSSSSQEVLEENLDSTVGDTEYYSDSPPRGGARIKAHLHPTPEVEEVKEVTEVATVNRELFPSTPQAAMQYILVVIHTPLPPLPLPSFVCQIVAQPPPPPMDNVPAFLLKKYAPLALPQVLNDMPQDYLKILPRFTGENEIDAQKHLETF